MYGREFMPGDLVWFDPGVGYVLPGEVLEFHKAAQVITVQAVINNVTKTFTLNNLSSVKSRQDLGQNGVEDMVTLSDLNEASILWNLRIRYDNNNIYTYIGSLLIAVNPYRMFDFYGLDAVSTYDGRIMGTLPPHLFAVGAAAYHRLLAKEGENQLVLITGESGAGKTESTKLLLQYLAAVNKSSSNLISEQILEASPLLESFGNAKTVRNDNSSRFGKYLEVLYRDGVISGAKVTDYLLEKSRIVSHAPEERNYHVFYELISGLSKEQRDGFGLMSAEKYFYLNQGGSCVVDGKNDKEDFDTLQSAMQVLGFTAEEKETVFKILGSILHLGNVYFHRKQLKHGQEGVEIGSDVEIKWTAHLLQLNIHGISRALVMKATEMRNETVRVPLNIDQALDARDAIAKALFSSLFTWLVTRINKICSTAKSGRRSSHQNHHRRSIISILDIFGFEDFPENSFEQLCINFANEALQHHFNKNVFKMEQAEYAKENLEWAPIQYNDNHPIMHMMAKKPVGIFHLLDDESNFPKATDLSFLEKCHYNHALNELYSRPRMSSMEFGIKHYAGQVWYNVEGFLDKNRDTLRYDVMGLLISSKDKLISKMFLDLRNFQEAGRTASAAAGMDKGGHFVTMKPRAPTVAARFHDSLNQLLHVMSESHPFYIRCLKPNNDKCPMKFDMPVVLEQLRYTGMLETVRIRKMGYPVRVKYLAFAQRYRCLLQGMIPRGAPSKEIARVILDREDRRRDLFALGGSKVFMREELEKKLEKERQDVMEVEVLKVQRIVRGYLARKHYKTMKSNAIKIQAAFRGYQVRKKYSKMRRGIVALQAVYRMRRQQSLYGEMKGELQRRAALQAQARAELQQQKKLRAISEERQSRKSGDERNMSSNRSSPQRSTGGNNAAVASVNHLEVPAQLAFIMSKLDSWQPVNTEKNLAKVSGDVAFRREKQRLPHDIDYYVFSKVANVYFKSHMWQMKREPIKTPFLSKSKETDYNESLAIFKLILRFMNDDKLGGVKEKVLADYIVNKGLQNEKLRDEIFCQLANQTWKNDNEDNCERGWLLFSQCISAFPPSKTMYKYLLKYASDHAYNGYRSVCQHKLLKAGKLPTQHISRQFPPTVLEWRSNKKRVNMALEAKCSDGYNRHAAVESLTTAEEFAGYALADRGIPTSELQGWTVCMEEGDAAVELNGDDFVMDAIGEIELPPNFPANRSTFIVTTDRSRGTLPLIINTGPHNNPRHYRYSASPDVTSPRKLRSRSEDRLLAEAAAENDLGGLLSKSALNDRYFEEKNGHKSKSLDNLLNSDSTSNFLGLSGSRLNRRYRDIGDNPQQQQQFQSPEDMEMESISQRGGLRKKENWNDEEEEDEDMGLLLSKTPINERYFSQPDLDKSAAAIENSVGSASRAKSQGNVNRLDGIDLGQFDYPGPGGAKSRLHGNPRFVKGQRKGGRYDKSSALSDTSEAPSIASHVRGVRVPSQASDVDQFLDDLFMPVLDGNNDDGLSDAKSLAASMRGGGTKKKAATAEDEEVRTFSREGSFKRMSILKQGLDGIEEEKSALSQVASLVAALRGGGKDTPDKPKSDFTPTTSAMGFQPIPGVISPTPMMMSPPPMLMPTPIHSLMPGGGGNPSQMDHPAMAFTYVPVPVYNMGGVSLPGMQGYFPGGAISPTPMMTPGGNKESPEDQRQQQEQLVYQQAFLQNAVAQNMQIQQQLMMQNQALTQLLGGQPGGGGGGAVGGPMSPAATASMFGTPMSSMMMSPHNMFSQHSSFQQPYFQQQQQQQQQQQAKQQAKTAERPHEASDVHKQQQQQQMFFGMSEAQRRASMGQLMDSADRASAGGGRLATEHEMDELEMRLRSQSFPNTPKTSIAHPPQAPMLMNSGGAMDPYTRARTIRIGKWRWPPPKDDSTQMENVEGFFEFKMRKMQERKMSSEGNQNKKDEFDGHDGIDWGAEYEKEIRERHNLQRSHSKDSFDDFKMEDDDEEDDVLDFDEEENDERQRKSPSGGSIGKLKLSNEMKQKLEAVTGGSRKNSVRSNGGGGTDESKKRGKIELDDDEDDEEAKGGGGGGIKKLAENRKLLLEQKLGGGKLKKWDTVDEVHRTVPIPDAPNRKTSRPGEIPLPPPPPPPLPAGGPAGPNKIMAPMMAAAAELKKKLRRRKSSSSSGSSSSVYSPDDNNGHRSSSSPTAAIKGKKNGYAERRPSVDTQKTDRTEKYELEESSEFLQPVLDPADDDYQTLERIKTAVLPPHSTTHFSYNRVPWSLKLRKEVFSPSETVSSPLAINLIFCQIVSDVFSPLCIRLTTEERSRMKTLLDEYDVDLKNLFSNQHKLSTKKNIIDMAKEFTVYFARLYPVSSGGGAKEETSQYLAISHSGVRLVQRQKSLPTDYMQVLETYNYEDIGEVSTVKHNGLQLVMHAGGRLVVATEKAGQIKELLNQYILESSSGQYDYAKALADFASRDESTLNFKKGDIIAVVPKRDAYTEKGWLYGIKDGHYGLFPSDFVERMSPQTVRREMRVIAKVTRSPNKVRGHSEESEEEEELDSLDGDDEKRKKQQQRRARSIEPDYSEQEDNSWEEKQRVMPRGVSAAIAADHMRDDLSEVSVSAAKVVNDGKNPLLEFAMSYFREREKFSQVPSNEEGSGTLKDGNNKKSKKLKKKKSSSAGKDKDNRDWTWKDQVDMVKWTDKMINNSLLRLEPTDVNKMALECFACIMRYMGDLPLLKNQHEVDCVNTILMYCHKFESVRDEVYCQIMKQTTNNKSAVRDSCQKGWRLFSIVAAYFTCSELLQPFLFKYLETAAYDRRRAYHGTALVCLHNLRKTFKHGGRKNVPSIEEITAISAGRSSKRQIYRLPGGTERVINTKSTTVVENIIEDLCNVIGVDSANEREEFSLYCIVEGETFTVPLAKEHYILDVTTELQRDGAIYYLIFCRSVWYYPLRLDNQLYIEVVFNQIAPDYLEGLLLVMPAEQIEQEFVYDISKVAALLHRAADMDHKPSIKETKFLLPKPALSARDIKPPQWVNMVQGSWEEIKTMSPSQAKAKVLEILSEWPLFGSSFFAVRREADAKEGSEHILALNKNGVSFLDLITHETLLHYPFTEVISTRKVQTEDGTLFLDMKCGNLMQQRITRIQTEQANEIARLIRQYITIDQRIRGNSSAAANAAAAAAATSGNQDNAAEEKRSSPIR